MFSDFSFIFYWWLMIFGIGVVFYPLTQRLLGRFWDKGYTFSKILGILLVSYVVWLLGSLKILPFSNETIWLVILGAIVGNYWIGRSKFKRFKKEIRKNWKIFAFEEGLFFLALTFWSFIRGFQPNIEGLEKFMDFGFVNSILRSQYFPPADMWLAGETINYYYFGHLVAAVLTKLSGIDSAITYNLMIASLFAFTFTASFSLGANFIIFGRKNWKLEIRNWKLPIIAGVLTACLVSLGGNLHPLWYLITHGNYRSYWYPDATRFIVQLFGAADNTIHEFPIYSFVVADLHGHLLNLPFVLLFLALLLVVFSSKKISLYPYIVISLLLGIFYMTNAWDFAIYNLAFGMMILLFNYFEQSEKQGSRRRRGSYLKYKISLKTIFQTAKIVLPVFIGSLIFSLPFHLNFKNLTSGIALTDFHTPPWMLLVLWGFPLVITTTFLIFLIIRKLTTNHKLLTTDIFVLIFLGVSWLLILLPEFIYIKDIYIHSYQRANTMFKLTYQSFVMFSLAGGYILVRLITDIRQNLFKFLIVTFHFSFLFFIFLYPYFAVRSYYGLKTYQGLYGLDYLKRSYPDDHQAILWLNQNITTQPTIIEAVGESYTDFGRVSANTGLPTILGWRVHEWLWRGSFDEPALRTEEVKKIYESGDLQETQMLLTKYKVNYIFLGKLENQTYHQLNEEKFLRIGKLIFQEGQTKIYKVLVTPQ